MKKILMLSAAFLIGLSILPAQAQMPVRHGHTPIKTDRTEQYRLNRITGEKAHEKYMASLKEKLAANRKLTDAQKAEVAGFFENQHRENVDFLNNQHKEDLDFIAHIKADPAMIGDRKTEAVKAFFKQQREETRQFHKQQRLENTEEVKKVQSYIENNLKQKGR